MAHKGRGRDSSKNRDVAGADPPGASEAMPDVVALDSVLGYLLRRAHYIYHTYWLEHFRDAQSSITPMQSGLLLMLRRHPDMTQTELARVMGIEVPTAFNLITKLQNSGYVERTVDPIDKRARRLQLTASGVRILEDIQALVPVRDAHLAADLSAADKLRLTEFLTRIILRGSEHLGISQEVVSEHPRKIRRKPVAESRPKPSAATSAPPAEPEVIENVSVPSGSGSSKAAKDQRHRVGASKRSRVVGRKWRRGWRRRDLGPG